MRAAALIVLAGLGAAAAGAGAAAEPLRERPAPPFDSLLFTGEEVERIEKAQRGEPEVEEETLAEVEPEPEPLPEPEAQVVDRPVGPGAVHLTGILYSGPDNWRIWLNGRQVTPTRRPGHVVGLSVDREAVRVRLQVSTARPPVSVRLRPNQSYIVATGEVIEGPPPPRLLAERGAAP